MEQTPGSNSGQTAADELKVKAQAAASQAKGKAQAAAEKVKDQSKQQLETGKESAAETVDQVADAVHRASDELHQQEQHGLADYASQIASGISSFADTLRNRSIDDLLADTQAMARRNPTIFFLSSVGIGLALSRFLKASARNTTGTANPEYLRGDDISYRGSSEWQQADASQSLYGAQPGSRPASSGDGLGTQPDPLSPGDPVPSATNPPGGTYS